MLHTHFTKATTTLVLSLAAKTITHKKVASAPCTAQALKITLSFYNGKTNCTQDTRGGDEHTHTKHITHIDQSWILLGRVLLLAQGLHLDASGLLRLWWCSIMGPLHKHPFVVTAVF
jgi:hypothetical protein